MLWAGLDGDTPLSSFCPVKLSSHTNTKSTSTDRQEEREDGRTDRQTDRQTDRLNPKANIDSMMAIS